MQDERIDSYLRGQMNKEEEILFENDLRTDAELRSRARFIAKTVKAMIRADNKGDMMPLPQSESFRMVAQNPTSKRKK